jgi:glycosyltransferase involved in cell wall biosynthesis
VFRKQKKNRQAIENMFLKGLMKFIVWAQMQLAAERTISRSIQRLTRRPSYLLGRGVDTKFLSPTKRRRENDGKIVLGFVGRLRPEKKRSAFRLSRKGFAGVED